MTDTWLRDPGLVQRGIRHGFGTREARPPRGLLRPRQVHGRVIASAADCRAEPPPEADGVVAREPGVAVAVVTADCVPILLAAADGAVVAAVHAGWRGLAAGVVAAGVAAVRRLCPDAGVRAAIGPRIGPCCYEVDGPVLDALGQRFGEAAAAAATPTRPGHAHIDLAAIAAADLVGAGVAADAIGVVAEACTACDARRFHSYRRDGPGAGRLVHYIAVRGRSES